MTEKDKQGMKWFLGVAAVIAMMVSFAGYRDLSTYLSPSVVLTPDQIVESVKHTKLTVECLLDANKTNPKITSWTEEQKRQVAYYLVTKLNTVDLCTEKYVLVQQYLDEFNEMAAKRQAVGARQLAESYQSRENDENVAREQRRQEQYNRTREKQERKAMEDYLRELRYQQSR